jgi:hypothetical protein
MNLVGYQRSTCLLCSLLTIVGLLGWYLRWSRWSNLLGKPTSYVGNLLA